MFPTPVRLLARLLSVFTLPLTMSGGGGHNVSSLEECPWSLLVQPSSMYMHVRDTENEPHEISQN